MRLTRGLLGIALASGVLAQLAAAQNPASQSPAKNRAHRVAASATPTPSPTCTSTDTLVSSPTDTPTPVGTDTPTDTPSPTATSTPSATATVTSTPGLSGLRIEPSVLPGPVTLFWENAMAADRLQLKVFTSSFRLLKCLSFDKETQKDQHAIGPQSLVWDGLDDRGKNLPSGTYFLFLGAKMGRGAYTAKTQVRAP